MRNLYKIIMTCIIFSIITTTVYATAEILPQNKFGIKKVTILFAGIFLIVQILFIAYQKDKLQEMFVASNQQNRKKNKKNSKPKLEITEEIVKNILNEEELEKAQEEEKNLFSSLKFKTEIETLPDKMSPKKRNITLKKETTIIEKGPELSKRKTNYRDEVKIVRERKNRNNNSKKIIKKEQTGFEVENEKEKAKTEIKEKKEEIKKIASEKKKETKEAGKAKKQSTKKIEKNIKSANKKIIDKK